MCSVSGIIAYVIFSGYSLVMHGLTKLEQQAVAAFRRELKHAFADKFVSLSLFGSKARGEARPDSDVDLLVILADKTWDDEQQIFSLVTEVFLQAGVVLSPKVYSARELEQKRGRHNVFVQDIDRDAVLV